MPYQQRVRAHQDQLKSDRFTDMAKGIGEMSELFPLLLKHSPEAGSDEARDLHNQLCAACHDRPELETERPAYNLFQEAKRLSAEEFFARLLVGVRGDRVTGIDNPLSDAQINALMNYYKQRDAP